MQALGHAVITPITSLGSWAAQHYIYAGAAAIFTGLGVAGSINETKGQPLKDRVSDAGKTALILGTLSTAVAIVAQKTLSALIAFVSAHPIIALGAGIVILSMIARNAPESRQQPPPSDQEPRAGTIDELP